MYYLKLYVKVEIDINKYGVLSLVEVEIRNLFVIIFWFEVFSFLGWGFWCLVECGK